MRYLGICCQLSFPLLGRLAFLTDRSGNVFGGDVRFPISSVQLPHFEETRRFGFPVVPSIQLHPTLQSLKPKPPKPQSLTVTFTLTLKRLGSRINSKTTTNPRNLQQDGTKQQKKGGHNRKKIKLLGVDAFAASFPPGNEHSPPLKKNWKSSLNIPWGGYMLVPRRLLFFMIIFEE